MKRTLLPLAAVGGSLQAKLPWTKKAQALGFTQVKDCQSCHATAKPKKGDALTPMGQFLMDRKAKEDPCVLGQWIRGQGGHTFAGKPEFNDMVSAHADFHQVAAQVLRLAQGGHKVEAERLLEGDFYTRSALVVTTIAKCKNACKL
jgi:hypothetical protein